MKVIIAGAGATGLAAAYLLRRAGHSVAIVEAAARAGGLLATFDTGLGDRLEYFYHHFFTHDAEINWLLGELGLQEHVTFRKTTMGVYRGGRLYPFNGLGDLLGFRAISLPARFRFGMSSAMLAYLPGYADVEDRTTLAWMDRWAGRAATNAIWRPLMHSKFGDIAERVPLAWMAGRLRQRARSRRAGEERLGYLRGSLQRLVDALIQWLATHDVDIHLSTPIESFVLDKGRVVGVKTPNGEMVGDAVLATIPTTEFARIVQPAHAEYARELLRLRYLGAICVVVAFKEPLSDTYWMNVADSGFDFGGIIEQTNFVDAAHYGGRHIVYFSRYLDHDNPLWSMPDEQLVDRYLTQAERLYGRPIKQTVLQSWVFRGKHAAPRTELGFHQLIPKFRTPLAGLTLASMCHVYPDERSVNNSIRVAAEAIRVLGDPTAADVVPKNLSLSARYGPD